MYTKIIILIFSQRYQIKKCFLMNFTLLPNDVREDN